VGLPVSLCDVAINPNNTDQRLVLWSNGRIDALGGAPTITASVTWYDRFEPPGRAITVSNWVTGAGYVLDYRGGFNPFNGAPDVGSGSTSNQMPGIPLTSAPSVRRYVDWAWDPALNGQGYVLDQYGQILPFGGASAPTFTGQRWNFPNARKLKMQFGATKRGVIMDQYGYLYPEFGATIGNIGPAWPGFNASRDMAVVAWNPITGYKLDLYGGLHGIGGLAKPSGFPYRKGADVGRVLDILSATNPTKFFVGWTQGQTYEVVSSTPPTVIAGVGINEVQTVTITGAPTGGTFTLTYSGQTTTALARTATAATVQAALEALSNIGVGDVVVTGGPGPTTPYVVTFTGVLGGTDTGQMTAAHTFTGGTTPGISVTTTTTGGRTSPATTVTDTTRPTLMWEYTDAQGDQQAEWQLLAFTQAFVNANTMTDPLAKASGAVVTRLASGLPGRTVGGLRASHSRPPRPVSPRRVRSAPGRRTSPSPVEAQLPTFNSSGPWMVSLGTPFVVLRLSRDWPPPRQLTTILRSGKPRSTGLSVTRLIHVSCRWRPIPPRLPHCL
jgi:hypothetical protein